MRKDVLVLEYQNVFDKVAVRIVHQDTEVLKRGKFEDNEIGVLSQCHPSFFNKHLFIMGVDENEDNQCFLVSKEEAKLIKDKVKAINKKYGRKERWRADVGSTYFCIVRDYGKFTVEDCTEDNDYVDDNHYDSNNYFQTREQAEEACRRVKEVLKDYQEESLNEVGYEG